MGISMGFAPPSATASPGLVPGRAASAAPRPTRLADAGPQRRALHNAAGPGSNAATQFAHLLLQNIMGFSISYLNPIIDIFILYIYIQPKSIITNVNPGFINPNGCLFGGKTISIANYYCLGEQP